MKNLQDILDAAARHGRESDPDHEVGDLQDVLRVCFGRLTGPQLEYVLDEAREQLDQWAPEIPCPECNEVGEPDCKTCDGEGLLTASGKKLTEV